MTDTKDKDIETAILRFAGGSQTRFAELIGGNCLQGHVHQWLKKIKKPSPFYSKRMQDVTDGLIQASKYHPEVFRDDAA